MYGYKAAVNPGSRGLTGSALHDLERVWRKERVRC
jgi:hypothetical protein